MGCTDLPAPQDLFSEMSWWISESSGVIQLRDPLPLDVIYPESHGAGEVGSLWREHHREFARFIGEVGPRVVFELGGAHGILELEYQSFDEINWTILEPNPHPSPGTRAKFIRGFFDEDFSHSGDFDTVVHSHLFEHVYDPLGFMGAL